MNNRNPQSCRRAANQARPRKVLTTALLMALAAPMAVGAQEASEASGEQEDVQQLDTLTVTGSRIRRSEVEGPAPVTVITSEQIQREGHATVYDALATLTEAIGTVEADAQWGQHTSNASPLNLRNMGPGRSLLLINGHRAADYPLPYGGQSNFQNFSNIPTAAIERIEVLATGASAIYGSDAVAGVINIILKKNYTGDQFRVKAGRATQGGRDLFDISWSGGRNGPGWSLTYALQHVERDPLFAGERKWMDSENDARIGGWNEADRAKGYRYNNYYDLARISRTDNGLRISPPAGACDAFGDLSELRDYQEYDWAAHRLGPARGQYCAAARNFHNWTIKDGEESNALYLYGTLDLSERTQAWASMMLHQTQGTSSIADFGMGYVPNVRWYDAGIGAMVEGKRFFTRPEIGDALTESDETSLDIAFGVKGEFGERFDWEAMFDHAEYNLTKNYPATIPAKVNDFLLGPQLGVTDASYAGVPVGTPIYRVDLNHFFSPINRDDWNAISVRGRDQAKSEVDQFQFVLSGDLFEAWAGPIGFAAVAEAARQSYELRPDPNTVPALGQVAPGPNLMATPYASPYYGYDLGGGARNRWAVGTEFRVPLWADAAPGLGSASMSLAARYDSYDQTQDKAKATWMTGLEWRPFDTLLVRGSYATSFRAPDMHYVYAKGGQSFSQIIDGVRCFRNGDIPNCIQGDGEDPAVDNTYDTISTRSGSPLLKYETGTSWTAGFVWDAFRNFSVSADYWNIELKDSIDNINRGFILDADLGCEAGIRTDGTPYVNPFTGSAPTDEFCESMRSRIDRNGPNGAITEIREGPINKSGRRVSGVDLSTRYSLETSALGNFSFGLNYTNLLRLSTRESEASEWTDGKEGAHRDIHTKSRAYVGWQYSNFDAMLSATRLSALRGNNFGGCERFDNGEYGTAVDNDTCISTDPTSVNFGQTTGRYWDREKAPVIFNLTAGYRFTENQKLNLFVNNITDEYYKERYTGDYVFYNSRAWSPVGREVALEYVVDFK